MHDPLSWLDDELAQLDAQGLRRRIVTRLGTQGATIRVQSDGNDKPSERRRLSISARTIISAWPPIRVLPRPRQPPRAKKAGARERVR